jgi:hypothetical protein
MMRINISRWLQHIHVLFKESMEEGIVDVQLPHVPSLCHGEGEDNTYSGGLDDRAVGIIVVDAVPLLEAFGDETRFVAIHSAIRSPLDLEHPAAVDDVEAAARGNKAPCTVPLESRELSIHCFFPARMPQSRCS